MKSLPLLPDIVKPLQDAPRAMKRHVGRAAQKVNEVTVSQLLDLPGLQVIAYEVEGCAEKDIVHLYCQHAATVALCPRCRTLSTPFLIAQRAVCATSICGASARLSILRHAASTVSHTSLQRADRVARPPAAPHAAL